MAMVNVNRENTDIFYRYKMPSLIAKVEGKGNGIKTVVVNMVEIGKALGRPPSYPCKFFGCELGAQTQMDAKIGRFIVNGAHDAPRLQDLLDGFIKKFVLCQDCDNPETELVLQQTKGRIIRVCRACGSSSLVDMRHKLIPFIFKNPPNAEEQTSGKKDKRARRQEKQEKGRKKDKEPISPTNTTSNVAADGSGDDEFLPLPGENGDSANGDAELEGWSVDTSEEAVKSRMEKLTDGATALALTDDLEKSSSERLDIFYKFVEDIKKKSGPAGVAASLPKIKAEAERLDLMDMASGIMAELLYTDKLLAQVEEYRPIMLHFVVSNPKGQKRILEAFEILVAKVYPQLMPKVPHILKAFYDHDILEEEVILEWHEKVSKKHHIRKEKAKEIREKAAPFITWLKTAEEESSGEEEDDVEVVYTEQTTGQLTVVSEPQQNNSEKDAQGEEVDEEDADLDIDAI